MVRTEELKRFREVAEWLESEDGDWWRSYTFHPIRHGHETEKNPGSFGFYTLKDPDEDVSGSANDFTCSMDWGDMIGDARLREEQPEPLVR